MFTRRTIVLATSLAFFVCTEGAHGVQRFTPMALVWGSSRATCGEVLSMSGYRSATKPTSTLQAPGPGRGGTTLFMVGREVGCLSRVTCTFDRDRLVTAVVAVIPSSDRLATGLYDEALEGLTKKYGPPARETRHMNRPFSAGDGDGITPIRSDEAYVGADWRAKDEALSIRLINDGSTTISYQGLARETPSARQKPEAIVLEDHAERWGPPDIPAANADAPAPRRPWEHASAPLADDTRARLLRQNRIQSTGVYRSPPPPISAGIGANRNGVLLETTLYGRSAWHHGAYLGVGAIAAKKEDLPLEANFGWVNYAQRGLQSAISVHGGYACRFTRSLSAGIGLGLSSRNYYLYGTSPVTGMEWRISGPTETRAGCHGWVEVAMTKGCGLRFQYGPARFGASVQWLFPR